MGIFDKAKEFLSSEEAEKKTDAVLDSAEKFATDKLGEDKAEKVAEVRKAIDEKLGNE